MVVINIRLLQTSALYYMAFSLSSRQIHWFAVDMFVLPDNCQLINVSIDVMKTNKMVWIIYQSLID